MKKSNYLGAFVGCSLLMAHAVMAMPNVVPTPSLISPIWQEVSLLAPFGEYRGSYTHQGVDIAAPMGTPLYAVAGGKVTKAAPDSKGLDTGGGHMVFIDHGDGAESRYMHLDRYAVKMGDVIEAGTLIGYSGKSGDATAPLLHYEYRIYGQPVDPYFIFEGAGLIAPSIDTFMVVQQ
ncbi:MAG: M23 family metallopeptidase [Cellulosilyticaceae bacterium]